MTFLSTKSSQTLNNQSRRSSHWSVTLILLVLPALLTGCATFGVFQTNDSNSDAENKSIRLDSSSPLLTSDTNSVPNDSLLDVVLPEQVETVILPTGPNGYASLEDLEELYVQALSLLSEDQISLVEDHLFTLNDQLQLELPKDSDANYISHRLSLQRRAALIEGILAEATAYAGEPCTADSLLAAGYMRLANSAFPDSLVPATGITLNNITADLLKVENKAVRRWVDYYTGRGRRTFQFWLDRKASVDSLVTTILAEYDLPRELIYLSMIESGLSTRAVSSVSAVGPWQFMAGTGKFYKLKNSWWVDERRDFEMSTRAAAKYLTMLHKQFGDWALVLAAYNTGENRVLRRIRQHGHNDFWNLRLPAQTTNHIPKFIAVARIGENPQKYGFTVSDIPPLTYDTIPVNDATDLELIARCAGVKSSIVKNLNPALLRGATPPKSKAYPVKVPKGTGKKAAAALRKIPTDQRLTWRRHKVNRGETLSQIAKNYGTLVRDVAKLNKLGDVHLIRPGDQLLIPMPAELADISQKRSLEKGHYIPPNGYVRVSYKVKSGDNLGKIAKALGVSIKHLRKVNAMHKTNLIHPGQRLYAFRPGK